MTLDNKKTTKNTLTEMNEALSKLIKEKTFDKRITCSAAHEIANTTGTSPEDIGKQIDLMEYRLTKCQLGLFGYKNKKNLNPDIIITPKLNQKIDSAADDWKISCIACWDIAKDLDMHRLEIGSACEKKGLRIKPCQLGAF